MAVTTTINPGPRSTELDGLTEAIESHPIWTELRGPDTTYQHLRNIFFQGAWGTLGGDYWNPSGGKLFGGIACFGADACKQAYGILARAGADRNVTPATLTRAKHAAAYYCIENAEKCKRGAAITPLLEETLGALIGVAGRGRASSSERPTSRANETAVVSEQRAALDSLTRAAKANGGLRAAESADGAAGATRAGPAAKSCLNSFTADTPVTLADGTTRPIKDVKVGDKVLATDPETGETTAEPVEQLIRHSGRHAMVLVTLADGSALDSTDGHPIWDATTGRFTDASKLHVGDKIETTGGTLITITGLAGYSADLTAYNLQISTIHTYYAGTTPVLVHNSCGSLDDALATPHGQQRLAERGFDSVDIALVRSSPSAYEQADGAIAHVGQVGRGSYNVIVVGNRGIVTAIRGVDQNGLNNLARNYGWSGYP